MTLARETRPHEEPRNVIGPRLAVSFLLISALAAPGCLLGQASPLVLEIHGGRAVPVRDFASGVESGEGVTAGTSLGWDLAFTGSGWRTIYAGFSQHRFACEGAGCAPGQEYVATGFDLGIRATLRFVGSVAPWIRLGAVTTHVEVPSLPGVDEGLSSLGLGWEGGVGLYIGVSSPVALVPGIRATAVNTRLPGGALLRMRYLVVDLALALAF
jgi:hypothetical protein